MHRAGGNIGHGGIFTAMSHDDAVADLKDPLNPAATAMPLHILTGTTQRNADSGSGCRLHLCGDH